MPVCNSTDASLQVISTIILHTHTHVPTDAHTSVRAHTHITTTGKFTTLQLSTSFISPTNCTICEIWGSHNDEYWSFGMWRRVAW